MVTQFEKCILNHKLHILNLEDHYYVSGGNREKNENGYWKNFIKRLTE